MEVSTITGKGQTTIPALIRQHLNIEAGDKVRYHIDPHGNVVLRSATGSIKSLKGMLAPVPETLSGAQISERMEAGVAKDVMSHDRD